MSKGKKVRFTTATYKHANGDLLCDLEELAKTYLSIGNIPENICFPKAVEIMLLSQAFLRLYKPKKAAS